MITQVDNSAAGKGRSKYEACECGLKGGPGSSNAAQAFGMDRAGDEGA